MTPNQDIQRIMLWLTKLALLTSGGRTPVTKQQIGLYAVTCSTEVPIGAFCDESLNEFARQCEYFPAYAVLRTALLDWWAHHGQAAIEEERPDPNLVALIEHRQAADRRRLELAADWNRPEGVERLVEGLDQAGSLRPALGRLLGSVVRQHAAQHLALLPEEFQCEEGDRS
jgi:hypothetical protein